MTSLKGGGLAAKPLKKIPQGEGGGGSARFENDDGWVTGRVEAPKSANN